MKLSFEHKGISIGLSVLMAVVFISTTIWQAINFPAAADDFILFISQLHDKFLIISGVKDVAAYFFAPAFGIHTKLSSRVLGLISYGIFGVINFKFLLIVGNLCYLFMAHKISDIATKLHQEPYLRPIILSLLLVPLALNFRPVFVTGFPFHILFAFLCFVFLTRKKIALSFLFFLLTAFNAGPGLFVGFISFVALIIYSIKERKYLYYVFAYGVGAFVILRFLFSYKTSATTSSLDFSLEAITSYIVYVLVFVQQSITTYLLDYKNFPVVYIFLGIAICAIFIYLLVRKFEKTINSLFFYLCVYLLILGLLAAVVRSGGTDMLPNVAGRYEHYSVIFMASLLGLIYGHITSPKIKTGIGIFFMVLFFVRFYTNTVSDTFGYQYATFVTPNGEKIQKLINQKKYQYLYDFEYKNIAQNASLRKEPKEEKRINKHSAMVMKYRDEKRVGVMSFMFKNKNEYKNVRVILQQGKKMYSFEPYQIRNKYYCVIAKNEDLPKGKYSLRVWYEDEHDKYEYKLKPKQKMAFY